MASVIAQWATPAAAALPGGTQDPTAIPKYEAPLLILPAMPQANASDGKDVEYYEIAVRQFDQQVLPPGMPVTTVWSYGAVDHPTTFHYPAFTIEARHEVPVRIKWINDLVDEQGHYLPHLLAVDQTLHWANPIGTCADGTVRSDCGGLDPTPYTGPVPFITHVHGSHVHPQYDGYPEAWYLPAALDIPADVAFAHGSFYEYFEQLAAADGNDWGPGYAIFEYPNQQNATTLWYHDHTLGLNRIHVYMGAAGFYIVRGGDADLLGASLPGPAPKADDLPNTRYHEIPLLIQDRSFNADGSLFYPSDRAFFEGLDPSELDISFSPDSDVPPIWNPEFFGNTIVVNGSTWPYLEVEQRRYRLRLLNGSQSRFLILANDQGLPMWRIGADGGFLPKPIETAAVLLGPSERADVIVDFAELPVGTTVTLLNLGPDEPFGGGEPGVDFEPSDPTTTGQVMQFRVTEGGAADKSDDPALGELTLPSIEPLELPDDQCPRRPLSLTELDSETVLFLGEPFGPTAGLLGTYDPVAEVAQPLHWHESITENPAAGSTEIWELYNFTDDAHTIHVHQVQFEVLNREDVDSLAGPMAPEWWEEGLEDTVIVYPDQITRIKVNFDLPGLYVWHCHLLEHGDNEMMRPFHVGPIPDDLPVPP